MLAWFCLFALPTQAHEVRPAYLEIIQQGEQNFDVKWKVPARASNLRLGLDLKFPADVEYIIPPQAMFIRDSYIERSQIRHAKALAGSSIMIDGLQSTLTDVLVRIERLDGSVQLARLMPDNPKLTVQATVESNQVAMTYLKLGAQHILTGVDHLLFLLCLLLIAGSAKRILLTVTGFTLAHSITLALSSLQIVTPLIAPVEAIIALSIVFLAMEIAKGRRDTLTWNHPITVAACFGLLHGFGFAAMLNELGLPTNEKVTGLLFFNIGVELGQLVFVLLVMGLIKLMPQYRGHLQQPLAAKTMAYFVGSLASFWMIQRSIESFV